MQDYDSSAKSYLQQNLGIIMSLWKMDQHTFAHLIGLNYPTFNNYMQLKTFPRIPTLMVISDVTGIPMDLFLRQLIPIHLIPEKPISNNGLSMVREDGPIYKTAKPPLLDYSELERRIEYLENELRKVLDALPAVAKNESK